MPPVPFGLTRNGTVARLFSLGNAAGFRADITDYGGAVVHLAAPDREGLLGDVVLGFDSVTEYEAHPFFLGAIIGRYANRIGLGRFSLDGASHQLSVNNGPAGARCQLHGGTIGFHKRYWKAEPFEGEKSSAVRLTLDSPAGEEGYPGNLDVSVIYTVASDRNDLRIDYEATSDAATPVNFTNHSYFNLRGNATGDVLNHILKIEASSYTPVNAALIPRGDLASVAGTPFDFRSPRAIGERIGAAHEQLRVAAGYDHNFVLDAAGVSLAPAATVREPDSGRVLEILTTEPGLQLYSGNFLDGSWPGKSGRIHGKHAGFCLETQHFPDSPNQPSFPSTILRPGQTFHSTTVFRFSTDR